MSIGEIQRRDFARATRLLTAVLTRGHAADADRGLRVVRTQEERLGMCDLQCLQRCMTRAQGRGRDLQRMPWLRVDVLSQTALWAQRRTCAYRDHSLPCDRPHKPPRRPLPAARPGAT